MSDDDYVHVPLKEVARHELHPTGTAARIAKLEAQIHAAGLPLTAEDQSMSEAEMRELLRWVYQQSRAALFERTHRTAGKSALAALSEINKRLADFR